MDYSQAEDLSKHRSWMIGLANHGMTSLRSVKGLWPYVEECGVPIDQFSVWVGKKEFSQSTVDGSMDHLMKVENGGEGYLIDRNYVVAAEAKYLNDNFGDDPNFTPMYRHKALYVDDRERRVLIRNDQTGEERYLEYDVLIGADGVRSVVRNAIQCNHRDFEVRVDDIFQKFKAVHVQLPSKLSAHSLTVLPDSLPNINGIALPEKGGLVCMSFGHAKNKAIDEELNSTDPKVVANYFRKNFVAFELQNYDDLAEQWVNQGWNTTGQVHCNYYHSNKLNALIIGDAAHATSPSIGMGMNTALADVQVLDRLLDEVGDDDWDQVRYLFSKERVKEGNALSDLAYYLFSFNGKQQFRYFVEGAVRTFLFKRFPNLCYPDPQMLIGLGYKLSEAYDCAKKTGMIDRIHQTNDTLRREHFEKEWGMVTAEANTGSIGGKLLVTGAVVAFVAFLCKRATGSFVYLLCS